MKTTCIFIVTAAVIMICGCGSTEREVKASGIDRFAESKVDQNGVETRPSGTTIHRSENGDK